MLTHHKHRSNHVLYGFRAVLVLSGLYFAYHAFHGDHGLLAYAQVQSDVESLAGEKALLTSRLAQLQARVEALQTEALDGDLVDERARVTLALIGQNELIIRR